MDEFNVAFNGVKVIHDSDGLVVLNISHNQNGNFITNDDAKNISLNKITVILNKWPQEIL